MFTWIGIYHRFHELFSSILSHPVQGLEPRLELLTWNRRRWESHSLSENWPPCPLGVGTDH